MARERTYSVPYKTALYEAIQYLRKGKSEEKVFKRLRHNYNVNSDRQIKNLLAEAKEYIY